MVGPWEAGRGRECPLMEKEASSWEPSKRWGLILEGPLGGSILVEFFSYCCS